MTDSYCAYALQFDRGVTCAANQMPQGGTLELDDIKGAAGAVWDAATSDCAVGVVAVVGFSAVTGLTVATGTAAVVSGSSLVTGTVASVALSGTVVAGATVGPNIDTINSFADSAMENLGACR